MNQCRNCNRKNIVTTIVPWNILCRQTSKKYYIIDKQPVEHEFFLCDLCRRYILESAKNKPKCSTYWPAMIWKFLMHHTDNPNIISLDLKARWKFIPVEWRTWWLTDVALVDETLSLTFPKPSFFLRTTDLEELQDAIDSLEWKVLGKAMDKYLSYPSVHCPFGCSEFLHLCNKLPIWKIF